MATATTRTFKSGNSVAVRLPKEIALPEGVDVTITRTGDVITIFVKGSAIKQMIARLRALPTPGEIQERDVDIFPERPGL